MTDNKAKRQKVTQTVDDMNTSLPNRPNSNDSNESDSSRNEDITRQTIENLPLRDEICSCMDIRISTECIMRTIKFVKHCIATYNQRKPSKPKETSRIKCYQCGAHDTLFVENTEGEAVCSNCGMVQYNLFEQTYTEKTGCQFYENNLSKDAAIRKQIKIAIMYTSVPTDNQIEIYKMYDNLCIALQYMHGDNWTTYIRCQPRVLAISLILAVTATAKQKNYVGY